jgi:hypothetical protein
MIIYGHKSREVEIASGQFHCPKCDDQRPYIHKRVAQYFTLFFIPLFKIKTLGEYVECQVCRHAFKPESLGLAPSAGSVAETSAQAKGERSPWGCILTVAGGLSLVVGALLFLLITASQLSSGESLTDNLEGFIGLLVICPLPLVILGFVLGGGGVFILRGGKTKDEENAEIAKEEDN